MCRKYPVDRWSLWSKIKNLIKRNFMSTASIGIFKFLHSTSTHIFIFAQDCRCIHIDANKLLFRSIRWQSAYNLCVQNELSVVKIKVESLNFIFSNSSVGFIFGCRSIRKYSILCLGQINKFHWAIKFMSGSVQWLHTHQRILTRFFNKKAS